MLNRVVGHASGLATGFVATRATSNDGYHHSFVVVTMAYRVIFSKQKLLALLQSATISVLVPAASNQFSLLDLVGGKVPMRERVFIGVQ